MFLAYCHLSGSVSYTHLVPFIRSISFEVDRGEIFGFLGPSGAGKSTLQKILTGILPGYSGSAVVSGKEVRNHGNSFYEQIGVDFEFPSFYEKMTARENLAFFGSLYRGPLLPIEKLLESVGLEKDCLLYTSSAYDLVEQIKKAPAAELPELGLTALDREAMNLTREDMKLIYTLMRQVQLKGAAVDQIVRKFETLNVFKLLAGLNILQESELIRFRLKKGVVCLLYTSSPVSVSWNARLPVCAVWQPRKLWKTASRAFPLPRRIWINSWAWNVTPLTL